MVLLYKKEVPFVLIEKKKEFSSVANFDLHNFRPSGFLNLFRQNLNHQVMLKELTIWSSIGNLPNDLFNGLSALSKIFLTLRLSKLIERGKNSVCASAAPK